jgi:hypothetical protein
MLAGSLAGSVLAALLAFPLVAGDSDAAPSSRAADSTATPAAGASAATDSAARARAEANPIRRVLAEADSALRRQGGPLGAGDAQLFLSWGAPWGAKRAQRSRMPACADSTREDTLYLSFMPGRRARRFAGFTAQVFLRATGGDTLGTWWHMEGKGGANAGSLRAEWAAAPGFGWPQPFPEGGQGFAMLDRTSDAVRLRMVFAVPADQAGSVAADSIYALCRVIFRHRPERRLAGCGQPVCVEWASATLAFGPRDEPRVSRGERFVGYGGPYALCEPFKGPRVQAWKPGAKPAARTPPGDTAEAAPR